jgi:hypothetical protein
MSHDSSPLVILLKIDATGIAVLELERDAPRSIEVDRITHGLKNPQRMEIKARNIHFLRPDDHIQAVEAAQDAGMHLRIDLSDPPTLPKLGETLASEAPDHRPERNLIAYICQLMAYVIVGYIPHAALRAWPLLRLR